MAKYNFDDEQYNLGKTAWDEKFNLIIKTSPIRLCTICKMPLPSNRYFFHDWCCNTPDDAETYAVTIIG